MERDGGLVRPSQSQEVERMDQRWKYNFIIHILLSIMTVLAAAALFLFYENRLAVTKNEIIFKYLKPAGDRRRL